MPRGANGLKRELVPVRRITGEAAAALTSAGLGHCWDGVR